jgi:threonine synthase
LANAMDVGDPSNFARILDLYNNDVNAIRNEISGARYSDEEIASTMNICRKETNYILDPHGACGYQALKDGLKENEIGVFLETAHPAKFLEKVEEILNEKIEIPEKLQSFMKGTKQSIEMSKDFESFKSFLMKI